MARIEPNKALKRELRILMELGYERSLEAELHKLDAYFTSWKSGEINPFELSEHIHKFHNGPARELYSKFTITGMNEILVATLISTGIVKESELSRELADFLSPYIEFINRERQ